MNLTDVQAKCLQTIIDLTRKDGCPPTRKVVREAMGWKGFGGASEDYTLRQLLHKGYLKQPHDRGPLVAAKSPDGSPLVLKLVRF